jgi:mannose-6-phosphate isomerase-like protein (cupin superfamily)
MDMLPVEIPASAECLLVGTDEITVVTTSVETGGALFAAVIRMRPGGGPPVLHRHAPGELYLVLAGEFTFHTLDAEGSHRRATATAGQVVPLAGGTPHTIRNESDADAAAFVIHAPGAQMENFARSAAALAAGNAGGAPDMSAVLAIAEANGIELLGPVPEPHQVG